MISVRYMENITNKKSFFDILAPKRAWNEQGVDEKYFFPTSHRIYCIQQKQCKNLYE